MAASGPSRGLHGQAPEEGKRMDDRGSGNCAQSCKDLLAHAVYCWPCHARHHAEFIVDFEDDDDDDDGSQLGLHQRGTGPSGQPQALTATIEELKRKIAEAEQAANRAAGRPAAAKPSAGAGQQSSGGTVRRGTPTPNRVTTAVAPAAVSGRSVSVPVTGKRPASQLAGSPAAKRKALQPAGQALPRLPDSLTEAKNKQSAQLFLQSLAVSVGQPSAAQQMAAGGVGSAVLRRAPSGSQGAAVLPAGVRAVQVSPTSAFTGRNILQRSAARAVAASHAAALDAVQPSAVRQPGRLASKAVVARPAHAGQATSSPVSNGSVQGTTTVSNTGNSPASAVATASRPAARPPAVQKAAAAAQSPVRPRSAATGQPQQAAVLAGAVQGTAASNVARRAVVAGANSSAGPASPAASAGTGSMGPLAAGTQRRRSQPGAEPATQQQQLVLADAPAAGRLEDMSPLERECRARLEYLQIKWQILKEQEQRLQTEWNEVCDTLTQELGAAADVPQEVGQLAVVAAPRRSPLRPGSFVEQRRAQLERLRRQQLQLPAPAVGTAGAGPAVLASALQPAAEPDRDAVAANPRRAEAPATLPTDATMDAVAGCAVTAGGDKDTHTTAGNTTNKDMPGKQQAAAAPVEEPSTSDAIIVAELTLRAAAQRVARAAAATDAGRELAERAAPDTGKRHDGSAAGVAGVAATGSGAAAGASAAVAGGDREAAGTSVRGAGASEAAAGTSARGAGGSEAAAGTSTRGAGGSETAAGTSARGAGASEAAAGTSARGAGGSEAAAGTSTRGAGGSETAAGTSARGAGASEAAAGTSARGAGGSEAAAGTSARGAGASEAAAGTSARGAGASEAAAGTSARGAGASEAAAGTSARGAGASEAAAGTSARGAKASGAAAEASAPAAQQGRTAAAGAAPANASNKAGRPGTSDKPEASKRAAEDSRPSQRKERQRQDDRARRPSRSRSRGRYGTRTARSRSRSHSRSRLRDGRGRSRSRSRDRYLRGRSRSAERRRRSLSRDRTGRVRSRSRDGPRSYGDTGRGAGGSTGRDGDGRGGNGRADTRQERERDDRGNGRSVGGSDRSRQNDRDRVTEVRKSGGGQSAGASVRSSGVEQAAKGSGGGALDGGRSTGRAESGTEDKQRQSQPSSTAPSREAGRGTADSKQQGSSTTAKAVAQAPSSGSKQPGAAAAQPESQPAAKAPTAQPSTGKVPEPSGNTKPSNQGAGSEQSPAAAVTRQSAASQQAQSKQQQQQQQQHVEQPTPPQPLQQPQPGTGAGAYDPLAPTSDLQQSQVLPVMPPADTPQQPPTKAPQPSSAMSLLGSLSGKLSAILPPAPVKPAAPADGPDDLTLEAARLAEQIIRLPAVPNPPLQTSTSTAAVWPQPTGAQPLQAGVQQPGTHSQHPGGAGLPGGLLSLAEGLQQSLGLLSAPSQPAGAGGQAGLPPGFTLMSLQLPSSSGAQMAITPGSANTGAAAQPLTTPGGLQLRAHTFQSSQPAPPVPSVDPARPVPPAVPPLPDSVEVIVIDTDADSQLPPLPTAPPPLPESDMVVDMDVSSDDDTREVSSPRTVPPPPPPPAQRKPQPAPAPVVGQPPSLGMLLQQPPQPAQPQPAVQQPAGGPSQPQRAAPAPAASHKPVAAASGRGRDRPRRDPRQRSPPRSQNPGAPVSGAAQPPHPAPAATTAGASQPASGTTSTRPAPSLPAQPTSPNPSGATSGKPASHAAGAKRGPEGSTVTNDTAGRASASAMTASPAKQESASNAAAAASLPPAKPAPGVQAGSTPPANQPSSQPAAHRTAAASTTPAKPASGVQAGSTPPAKQPSSQPAVHPTAAASTTPAKPASGVQAGSTPPAKQPSSQPAAHPTAAASTTPAKPASGVQAGSTPPAKQPSSQPAAHPTAAASTTPAKPASGVQAGSTPPAKQPSSQPAAHPTAAASTTPAKPASGVQAGSTPPAKQPSSQPAAHPTAAASTTPAKPASGLQAGSTPPAKQPSSQPAAHSTAAASSQGMPQDDRVPPQQRVSAAHQDVQQKPGSAPATSSASQQQAASPATASGRQQQAAPPATAPASQQQAAPPATAPANQQQAARPATAPANQQQAAPPATASASQQQAAPLATASARRQASIAAGGHQYESPLLALRAYRLTPMYENFGGSVPTDSPSVCNALDAIWPLCQFDVRGSCRDMRCPMQHLQDGELVDCTRELNLRRQAVQRRGQPCPLAEAAAVCAASAEGRAIRCQGRAAHIPTVARVKAGLDEDPSAANSGAPRLGGPLFSSILLGPAPAPGLRHPTLAWLGRGPPTCRGIREERPPALNWLPAGPGPQEDMLPTASAVWEGAGGSRGLSLPNSKGRGGNDARQNRYFTTATGEPAAAPSAKDSHAVTERINSTYSPHVGPQGQHTSFWLQWACEHLGFGEQPTSGADQAAALDVLWQGVQRLTPPSTASPPPDFAFLLSLALPLFTARAHGTDAPDPADPRLLQCKALAQQHLKQPSTAPALAYRLSLALEQCATSLTERTEALKLGVEALARPLMSASQDPKSSVVLACCMDLGLRAVQVLLDRGHHKAAQAWVNCLMNGNTFMDFSGKLDRAVIAAHASMLLYLHKFITQHGQAAEVTASLRWTCQGVRKGKEHLQWYVAARLGYAQLSQAQLEACKGLSQKAGPAARAASRVSLKEYTTKALAVLRAGTAVRSWLEPLGAALLPELVPVQLQLSQQPAAEPAAVDAAMQAQQAQTRRSLAAKMQTCIVGPPLPDLHPDLLQLRAAVGQCTTSQEARAVAELAWSGLRFTPHLPQVLLALSQWKPAKGQSWFHPPNLSWLHYVLPLLATALVESYPRASTRVWVDSYQAVQPVSAQAARELLALAMSVYPHDEGLKKLLAQQAVTNKA